MGARILAGVGRRRVLRVMVLGILGVAAGVALWSGFSSAAAGPTCSVRWASSVDGSWSVGANWSSGVVPVAADDVCIDVAGTYRVTVGGTAGIHSLTLGGATGTQTLAVTDSPDGTSGLDLASASTVGNNGVLELGPAAPSKSLFIHGSGPVVNRGMVRFAAGTGFRGFLPGLTNVAGGTVDVRATFAVLLSPAVVNDGAFIVHPGAELAMWGESFASNPGSTIDVGGAFTTTGATFSQAGGALSGTPIELRQSTLADSAGPGTFVFRGQGNTLTGTIPAAQTVSVEGRPGQSADAALEGVVTNNGSLLVDVVDSAAVLTGPGSLANNGTLRTLGSESGFRILGVDVTNGTAGRIEVGAPGTMFDGAGATTTTNDGAVSVTAFGRMFVYRSTFVSNPGSHLEIAGGGTVTVHDGTFRQAGGAVAGAAVTLQNGSTLDDSAGPGSFVLEPGSGGTPNVLHGTLPAGRLVTVLATADGDSVATLAGPSVVNDGVLRLASSAAGRSATLAGAPLMNNGWLAMMPGEGQRYLRAPLTNNGELAVGATTLVDAGTAIVNNGLVSLEDDVDLVFTGGSFTNRPTATLRVTVNPAAPDPARRVSVVGGTATSDLAGTLDVVTLGSPVIGRTYTPVAVSSRVGTFSSFTSGVAGYGVTYSSTTVDLVSTPSACSVRWVRPVGGDWGLGANWSSGTVPVAADDVCIDVAGTYRVTVRGAVPIRSLTLGGAPGTQTLAVADSPDATDQLELAAASIIESTGVLELEPSSPVASVVVGGVGPVVNRGTLRFASGPGRRGFLPSLTNAAGGTIDVAAASTMVLSPQLLNDGSIVVRSGATFDVRGQLFASNSGSTIDVAGAFTTSGTTFTQAGGAVSGTPIELRQSTLADGAGTGSFVFRGQGNTLSGTVPGGQTVTLEGRAGHAGITSLQGMVTIKGTLRLDVVDGAATLAGPGSLVNSGTVRTLGSEGGLRILGVDITNTPAGRIEVDAPGTVLDGSGGGTTTTNDGTISVTPFGRMLVRASTLVSNPPSTLEIAGGGTATVEAGTFRQAGGTVSGGAVTLRDGSTLDDSAGPGAFILAPGATPNVLRGSLPTGRLVTVQATADGDSVTTLAGPSVLNHGVLRLASSAADRSATLTGAPLTNAGWLVVMPGPGERRLRAPLTNDHEMAVGATTVVDAGTAMVNNGLVSLEDDVDLVFTGGAFTNGATGTLRVTVNPAAADPASRVSAVRGTVAVDLAGTLDVVTLGTPVVDRTYEPVVGTSRAGTFGRLTSGVAAYEAAYSPTSVALVSAPPRARFVPLSPSRVLDTRLGTGAPAGRVVAGGVVELTVAGRGGVPASGAAAVALTVTGTQSSVGFVAVWPTGEARPTTSNLNMTRQGQTIALQVIVPVGADGKVSLFTSGGGHLLADVAGWYETVGGATAGRFRAVTPSRLLDTRSGTGAPAGRRGPGASLGLPVTGRGGVPATGASAVVLSVTAADSSPGFVTAWPSGQARPTVSNLNTDLPSQVMAAHVVVPLGVDGAVSLYTSGGGHLLVDVVGWFTDATASESTSGLYVALSPQRRLDTRIGLGVANAGRRSAGSTLEVPLGGSGGIPATGVAAVVATLTAVEAAPTFLTAWAGGSARPVASNLNVSAPGDTVPNLVTSPSGGGTALNLYTDGATHLLLDTTGYYRS